MGVDRIAGGVTLPRPCSSVLVRARPCPSVPIRRHREEPSGVCVGLRRGDLSLCSFEQPDCHASLAMTIW